MNSALFLDLGGTLLRIEHDEIYVSPKGCVEVLPNVVEVLKETTEDHIFIVTNQSAIDQGLLSPAQVEVWINTVFNLVGRPVSDYWACPYSESQFRKPAPSMVQALADKHYVDLGISTYVGDSESDFKCASAAGIGQFIWAEEYFRWP